jgi:hypothetical protein
VGLIVSLSAVSPSSIGAIQQTDYSFLETSKALAIEAPTLGDIFKEAVAEGDKKGG